MKIMNRWIIQGIRKCLLNVAQCLNEILEILNEQAKGSIQ